MTKDSPLAGIPRSTDRKPPAVPASPVPPPPTYPNEAVDEYNYRIIQDNQRARRVAGGGV